MWMACRQGLLVWLPASFIPASFASVALHHFHFRRVIPVAVTCQRLIMMRCRKYEPQTSWASLQHGPQVKGHQRRHQWCIFVTSMWQSTFMHPFPPHRQLIKAESSEGWSATEPVSSQSVLWVSLWSVETKDLTVRRLFSSWVSGYLEISAWNPWKRGLGWALLDKRSTRLQHLCCPFTWPDLELMQCLRSLLLPSHGFSPPT